MVFEKFESWNWSSPATAELFARSWEFWGRRGYELASTGGTSFRGRSFQSKIGIHRVVDVTVLPAGDGSVLQLRFRADVRADVAAGGAVVAVLLLPLAVVGAAVSWHEYEADWSRERWEFWNYLVGTVGARPAAGVVTPPPPLSRLFDAPSTSGITAGPPAAAGTVPPAASTAGDVSGPAPSGPPTGPVRCPRCRAVATGEGRFCSSCGSPIRTA